MEDHDNEMLQLVLDNCQYKVYKKKLINKSHYFSALFSGEFVEDNLSEHHVCHDFPATVFLDFINWINSDKPNVIEHAEYMGVRTLLTLMKISDTYQIKDEFKLTETIIDIFQNRKWTLQDAFNAWQMAKNLDYKILRDLYFSVCLDRFTELPTNLICELSEENFVELIKNTNLRIPKTIDANAYLSHIAQEWLKVNKKDKFTNPLGNLEKTRPKVYPSIIFHHRQESHDKYEFYLHCWDGDKSFELATFKLPEELINKWHQIEGMKITTRGHNLYFIGGEFTQPASKYVQVELACEKRFNEKVWRYSLITNNKNWYFETTMPRERRDMIAAFAQNKLLLAGGYGCNNQILTSLDIYDVHKGTWTKGVDMPFTYMESYGCFNVVNKYLICFPFNKYMHSIFIYDSENNYWHIVAIENEPELHLRDLHIMTASVIKQFKTASCDFDKARKGVNLKSILCDNSEYKQKFYKKYAKHLQIEEKYKKQSNFDMYFLFIKDVCNCEMYNYYVLFCSKNENKEYKLVYLTKKSLPWPSVPMQHLNTFQSSTYLNICSTMFSSLMDPADLYAN